MIEDKNALASTTFACDTFIAAIPWDDHRVIVVHRRRYGGRTYVKLHTWNRHLQKEWWYPSSRMYVIPEDRADALADAIRDAARGEQINEKPAWLQAFEDRDPSLVKKGSIRRSRKEAIIAERREQVAGVVAGLERAVDRL